MTKLSDAQAVILSTASQRNDGAVLPLPEILKIKGGALDKVLGSLKAKGLIDHQGVPRGDNPPPLRITSAGLEAIGVETEDETHAGPSPADHGAPPTGAEGAPANCKANARAAKANQAALADKPTPRAGTKQALMIEMLKRPGGATVEQIAKATGWQHHTIRGAISGALKKKLGLDVVASRTREIGPNKTGAKGRSTVYRILGQAPARRRQLAERAAPRRTACNRAPSAKTSIAKR